MGMFERLIVVKLGLLRIMLSTSKKFNCEFPDKSMLCSPVSDTGK